MLATSPRAQHMYVSRMQRNPFYYILAADSRYQLRGRHLENLGSYDPVPGVHTLMFNLKVA